MKGKVTTLTLAGKEKEGTPDAVLRSCLGKYDRVMVIGYQKKSLSDDGKTSNLAVSSDQLTDGGLCCWMMNQTLQRLGSGHYGEFEVIDDSEEDSEE